MNIFLNLNKKSVVLCTMLTYSLPSYLDAANGAFDPNRAIEVVAGLIGKNMDDRASSGAQSRDFNFGANPSSPGGLQLPSSLIPGGSQGAGVPGALPGMPGAPGMPGTPGTPGTGGSTIIQNFNINIGEQPPKGFSLATGSDGKPVEPKT
nr:hypothetical protein [Pseudomonadota bacterium]